jgi:hypothetical protein
MGSVPLCAGCLKHAVRMALLAGLEVGTRASAFFFYYVRTLASHPGWQHERTDPGVLTIASRILLHFGRVSYLSQLTLRPVGCSLRNRKQKNTCHAGTSSVRYKSSAQQYFVRSAFFACHQQWYRPHLNAHCRANWLPRIPLAVWHSHSGVCRITAFVHYTSISPICRFGSAGTAACCPSPCAFPPPHQCSQSQRNPAPASRNRHAFAMMMTTYPLTDRAVRAGTIISIPLPASSASSHPVPSPVPPGPPATADGNIDSHITVETATFSNRCRNHSSLVHELHSGRSMQRRVQCTSQACIGPAFLGQTNNSNGPRGSSRHRRQRTRKRGQLHTAATA